MQGHTAQLLITLSPKGALQVELPASNGQRRIVPLTAKEAGPTLLRMLHARLSGQVELGFDGAPTAQQVLHWEKHSDWPRDNCRFCLSEGRIRPQTAKRTLRTLIAKTADNVEIHRVKEQTKGPLPLLSLEDLGL